MMMKKTTSALAVAALLGTGAASAATFQVNENSSLTVGGDFRFFYNDVTQTDGSSETTFTDDASSLVFAGEQTHDNGITTGFYLDFDGFGTLGDSADGMTTDEYSISFAGDFGEIVVGQRGDVVGPVLDTVDIAYGNDMIVGGGDSTEVVQYHSNDLNGISYALQAQLSGDTQKAADPGDSSVSVSGYLEANLGGITFGAGYDQRATSQDEPISGVAASTTINNLSISASFVQDEAANAENDRTALALSYNYGAGSISGGVNSVEYDVAQSGETDFTQYVATVTYNVLSNTTVFAEIGRFDQANDATDNNLVGLTYAW